jgi:ATP-dependent nuclease subunit A
MKFSDFTKEQQLAITTKGTNVIVSAGAGSGKTAVLTQRVLYFIQNEGYKINEFLILTFTKLAAGEMKERIRKALSEAKLDDANAVDHASITTFDAYALSLVKKYHFLLNVSSDIKIIDTNIISVRKRTLIKEIFNELYEQENPSFLDMIRKYAFKDDIEIRDLVLKLSDKANLEIDSENYLNHYIDKYYQDEVILDYVNVYIDRLKEMSSELEEKLTELPTILINKKDKVTYQQAVLSYLNGLFSATTYDEYIASIPKESFPRIPIGLEQSEKDVIHAYKEKYKELREWIDKLPRSKDEFFHNFKEEIPYVKVLIDIVKELHVRISQYKSQYDVYEFQDIAKMALSIVKEHHRIKEEIQHKLKMIMIDEYQDTSILQEEFINTISNQNVYMVGDIKQSIYRFRNAKSDIFAKKYEDYTQNKGGIAINLNKNFRSRKEVLEDINYLFTHVMTKDLGKADYAYKHRIEYGNTNYVKAGPVKETRHSSFILYPPQKSSMNVPVIEANLIANDIVDKMNNQFQVYEFDKVSKKPVLRNCRFSDFCILMDRGSAFDIYAKVFSEYKIPLFIENDENIRENDVVFILTNLLRLIKAIQNTDYQNTDFRKAFISVTRSFLYQYSDQTLYEICKNYAYFDDPFFIKLKELVINNGDLPIASLFTKIIFELDIYQKCIRIGNIERNEKYLDTFISMFKEMSKLDYTIDDFIMYMEYIHEYELKITLSSNGTNLDSVRIMNIHKSKGLEFPIVYFSGLKKNFNQTESKESFGVSSQFGLILPPNHPNQICIPKDLNTYYEHKEDISEKIRLLYVSLTRTKEKMIFILEEPFFSGLKFANDLKLSKTYYHQRLKNQSSQEALKIIFDDYVKGNMNKQVFENLICFTHTFIPESFKHRKREEVQTWNFQNLQESITNYYSYVIPFSEQLITNYHDHLICVKKAIESYLNHEVSLGNLTDILYYFGYTLNQEFYSFAHQDKFSNYQDKMIDKIVPKEISFQMNPPLYTQLCNAKNKLEEKRISERTYLQFKEYIDSALEKKVQLEDTQLEKYIFKEVLLKIKKEYECQNITVNELNCYLELLFIRMPYITLIENRLSLDSTLTKHDIETAFYYLGFEPTSLTQEFLNHYYKGKMSKLELEKLKEISFFQKFKINVSFFENFIDEENFEGESILKKIYNDYLNQKLTKSEFENIIDVFGFQLQIDFKMQNELERSQIDVEKMDEIVVERGKTLENREKLTNFYQFIYPFYRYRKFETIIGDLEVKRSLRQEIQSIIYHNLEVEELPLGIQEIHHFRPSKELKIGVAKQNMEFGTHIHYIMEIMDFKKPDYSIIDPFYQAIIKRFLGSPLMKQIKEGNIYKEYVYVDEEERVSGVIDLMVIYDNYIDIIDYKTKNIHDTSYNIQLEMYASFVRKKFGKRTNAYLYALLTGECQKVL